MSEPNANLIFDRPIVTGSGAARNENCSVELLGLAIYGDYRHGYQLPCLDEAAQAAVVRVNDLLSDHPACASTVVGAFLRAWNDALPDSDRQQLKRYISRLVGSKGTADQEDERAWMALDWLVRSYTPVWLRVAGLHDQAGRMRRSRHAGGGCWSRVSGCVTPMATTGCRCGWRCGLPVPSSTSLMTRV